MQWSLWWLNNLISIGQKPTATIESVSVEPCTIEPCQFHKGKNGTVSIKFTPTTVAEQLTSKVNAKVGAWIPYPLHNQNACKDSGLKCSLKPGLEALYHATVDVKPIYPTVSFFQPCFHLQVILFWPDLPEGATAYAKLLHYCKIENYILIRNLSVVTRKCS